MPDKDDNMEGLKERIDGNKEQANIQLKGLKDELALRTESIEKRISIYVAGITSAFIIITALLTFFGYKNIKGIANETTKEIVEKLAGEEIKKYVTKDYAEELIREKGDITIKRLVDEFEDKLDKKTREKLSKLDEKAKKVDEIVESSKRRSDEFFNRLEKKYTFDNWYQKGLKEYNTKNYENVITYMDKAIDLDTKQADVYLKRGDAYGRLKKYKSAIDDYNKAIKLAPENTVAYEGISEINIIMGNYEVAKKSITKALSLSLENKDKAIFLYLECIANKLLGDDTSKLETKLKEVLGGGFTIERDFDLIETWLKDAGISDEKKIFIAGKTNMIKWEKDMVFIKGGCFDMGDKFGDGEDNEAHVHKACVDDFYMSRYEVTVGEFSRFINEAKYETKAEKEGLGYILNSRGDGWELSAGVSWKNPGFPQNDFQPVVLISWNDAMAYIEWLRRKDGKEYRLPTEAEWEYAARSGGKKYKYSWGNGSPEGNIAGEETKERFPERPWPVWKGYKDVYVFTASVGSFEPNESGLYDMTGNVWEWCSDWYGSDYYKSSPKDNPEGPSSGDYKVLRGGSWFNLPGLIRASNRFWNLPDTSVNNVGFRLSVSAQ